MILLQCMNHFDTLARLEPATGDLSVVSKGEFLHLAEQGSP